jgi:hypothetical protein
VVMNDGEGLKLLGRRAGATIAAARANEATAEHADALDAALKHIGSATRAAWGSGDPTVALANATPYLQAFGHTVLAWIWLDVAVKASGGGTTSAASAELRRGKLAACRYFYRYELPRIGAWLGVVERCDDTCRNMDESWF